MAFTIFGLNHKTAPLSIREKSALNISEHEIFLDKLLSSQKIHEAMLLSTCNRTEIFCETNHPETIIACFAKHQGMSQDVLSQFSYIHQDNVAIHHAIRLACGLDSMMIGEPQILGQLKKAYQLACDAGTIKKNLKQIFEFIFKTSKSIRVQSGIGNNPVSIAYAAVVLINQWICKTKQKKILLIGSGETAALVAKYLHQQGINQFFIASRTQTNAQKLAQTVGGSTLSITDIPNHLAHTNIVISATSCPIPFINRPMVLDAMAKRAGKPMFFLDLAIPRDIEPDIGLLEGITLHNIDDLHAITDQGLEERKIAAEQAEILVKNALTDFIRWQRVQHAGKTISTYREHMTALANMELQDAISKLNQGDNPIDIIKMHHHRLLNKLIHHPSEGLREMAQEGRQDLFELIHCLYDATGSTAS